MATVTRRDRFVDLAALLLLVLGVALYADGTGRLREISQLTYRHPGARGIRQLDVADRARYEANAGIAVVLSGIAAGIVSATTHARRRAA